MGTAQAGFNTKISICGAPVALVDAPMGPRGVDAFWVSSSAQRILNPHAPVVVKDNGTPINPATYTVDHLSSVVTFPGTLPSGPVTLTGEYLPTYQIATAYSLNYVRSRAELDSTVFSDTGAARTLGLTDVSGSVEMFQLTHNAIGAGEDSFIDLINNAVATVIEIRPNGSADVIHWAWVLFNTEEMSTTPDGRVEGTLNYVGASQMGTKIFSIRN